MMTEQVILFSPSMFQELRQAGTWNPFPECLHLHLDRCLLQQQHTKKLEGSKSNYTNIITTGMGGGSNYEQ